MFLKDSPSTTSSTISSLVGVVWVLRALPAPVPSLAAPVTLVAGHARLLADARSRLLHPDLAPAQVVAVQLPQDLVDLAPAGVGVDVDEPEVLDDVGLNHRREAAEQVLEGGWGRALGQVAHKQLGRRLPRPS